MINIERALQSTPSISFQLHYSKDCGFFIIIIAAINLAK